MSLALNGAHIEGGTFNNVSGNMSQVLTFHVATGEGPSAPTGYKQRLGKEDRDLIGALSASGVFMAQTSDLFRQIHRAPNTTWVQRDPQEYQDVQTAARMVR